MNARVSSRIAEWLERAVADTTMDEGERNRLSWDVAFAAAQTGPAIAVALILDHPLERRSFKVVAVFDDEVSMIREDHIRGFFDNAFARLRMRLEDAITGREDQPTSPLSANGRGIQPFSEQP